jgi:hypothetical protein
MERLDLQCLYDLHSKWRSGPEGALNVFKFCMGLGAIANEYVCPKCNKSMRLTERKDVSDGYVAPKSPLHTMLKGRLGLVLGLVSRLTIVDVLLMTEFFVRNRKQEDVCYELRLGKECVCDWRSFFREVCMDMLTNEISMIGGEGKIVEIDENKFGKRKYNRGKRVDGR